MSDQIDKDLKEAFIIRDSNNDLKKQSEFIAKEESSIKINSIQKIKSLSPENEVIILSDVLKSEKGT